MSTNKPSPGTIERITLSGGKTGYFARLSHEAGAPTGHCWSTEEEARIDLDLWAAGLPARMKEVYYLTKPAV